MTERILVVEDEEHMRFLITETLRKRGYQVEEAASAEEGIEKVEVLSPDVVVMDILLPGMSGLEAINKIHKLAPTLPVIVITALNSKEIALEAVKMGAYDFFTKPFKLAEMEVVVNRAVQKNRLERELSNLQERLQEQYRFENIVGQSGKMQEVLRLVYKVARTDVTVLIVGESGTGKELIASAIHQHSSRAKKPMVKLNCAAIPEGLLESELFGHEKGAFTGAVSRKTGKFELAHQGTIFLDEIGDMTAPAQAKVLRVLQERAFERVGGSKTIAIDVRVIAATNKSLDQEVKAGRFREDLFFRLNVFPIILPPLRERKEDIPLLAEHFMARSSARIGLRIEGLSKEALEQLQTYDWPGNVRELENVVERAMIMAERGMITSAHLPSYLRSPHGVKRFSSLDQTVQNIERDMIIDALKEANWVQSRAAKALGISERSLWHRVKKHRIDIKRLQHL